MKSIVLILIFALCGVLPAHSAIPTVEGLFRNINNKDVDGPIVVISFKIEEQSAVAQEDGSDQEKEEAVAAKEKITKYVKIFLSVENPKRIEYLKIEYNGAGMSSSGVSKVSYYPNILDKMKKDTVIERELFISMINMFSLNDSRGISQFLSRYNKDYFPNSSVLNEKKVSLYNRYKSYLTKIHENKDLKDELQSPFKNDDPEKETEIKKTLKDSMYIKSKNVFLHKEGKDFFWKVSLDTTNALFGNNNLKLKQIVFNNGGGTIDLRVGEYLLFDGVHELPKIVYFKNLAERVFRVRILKYNIFSKLSKSIEERYREMKEQLAEAAKEKELLLKNSTSINTTEQLESNNTPEIFFY